MLEKIIKILFLIGIGAVGLLLIITDMVVAIAEFRWWAFLVIPVGFIVFEIGFIAALILSDWIVYAIKNRTFKGFLNRQTTLLPPCESDYAGLKVKYRVYKSRNNEPVEGCFVLRPDKDPASRSALRTYMRTTDNLVLKNDLNKWLEDLEGGNEVAANNRCSKNSQD